MDIESEAESYLIHSLARAGGARAFAEYFDGIGPRPYEMRLLMAMAQHFRRFSLYSQAAEADKLEAEAKKLAARADRLEKENARRKRGQGR